MPFSTMRILCLVFASAIAATALAISGQKASLQANEAFKLSPSDECVPDAFLEEQDGLERLANDEFHPSWGRCVAAAVSRDSPRRT